MAVDTEKIMRGTFELVGVPTTLLIDRDGKVIFRHLGFSTGDERTLQAEVRLLTGASPGTSSRILAL